MQDARADYLLLLSNRCRGQQALQTYRKRWGIERLFWHMKRKGFDLEATHITSAKKLDKLFMIVSLAFLICFAWGCRIRFYKQHSSQQSQLKSLFRSRLEDILRMMQQRYSEHSKTRQDSGVKSRHLKNGSHEMHLRKFSSCNVRQNKCEDTLA